MKNKKEPSQKIDETIEDQFVDESGDRKYFTQIPNIVIDTLDFKEMSVYLHIKRKAGEKGIFSQTQERAAKQLGMNRATYLKYLKSLVEKGFIVFDGQRIYKTRPVNVYKIIDIWIKNTEFYAKRNK